MRKPTIKVIDNHEYEFLQLGGRKSFILLNRILKLIAPAVSRTIMSIGKDGGNKSLLDIDIDENTVGKAIDMLVSRFDENENIQTCELLFESVMYKGQQVGFETLTFEGDMMHMLKVLKEAIEVNVGNFSKGIAEFTKQASSQTLTQEKQTS